MKKKNQPNKTYLVRKNIEEPFGPENWYIFREAEFCEFRKTEEFKKCARYFTQVDTCEGGGDIIIAECEREKALRYERECAKKRYNRKQQIESGITILSLEKILDQEYSDCDENDSDLLIIDPSEDVEAKVIENEFNAVIHAEVDKLHPKRKAIINAMFFGEKPCTELKCAKAIGTTDDIVHYQKNIALESMKEPMSDWRFD